MGNQTQFQLTKEQAKKAINMCLENAESYLNDADMYLSNNKTDHLAIPIEFAMEEIGKAKIIYDKLEENNSKIPLSYKDGIYQHKTKIKKAMSLVDLDISDEIAESLLLGDVGFDDLADHSKILAIVKQENELKNTGKQGHNIRLASSYVDFDSISNEPKIEKSSGDLTALLETLYQIIHGYPSSFHIN